MKIEIDLTKCKRNKLRPDHFVVLYILYYGEKELAQALFTKEQAFGLRDDLIGTKYILSATKETHFFKTLISTANVEKLLDIRADKINFLDFFIEYPMKVGARILRPKNLDTQQGRKFEKKYLSKVKTKDSHLEAVAAVKAFVTKQRRAGKMQYLPNMETVLNNAMWESWSEFIESYGNEGANSHVESI